MWITSASGPIQTAAFDAGERDADDEIAALKQRLDSVDSERAALVQRVASLEAALAGLSSDVAEVIEATKPFDPAEHLQKPITSQTIDGVEFRLEKVSVTNDDAIFEFIVLSPDRDAKVSLAETVRMIDENGQEFRNRSTSLAPAFPRTSGDVNMDLVAGIPMRARVLVGGLGESERANLARFSVVVDGPSKTLELRGVAIGG